jgi:hypothetical protein
MAISRSLMNRQLRADGGIMQVAPREKFGLGSSLKKFVRKIIPNEVADIAVKAAPFVAPFNPALAGAMAGIGSFDQTGSIGDSLKRGALTYGGGQAARYIGGAGFQGNPFASGGAFTPAGFTSGFSSPLGTSTGLGKFFSNQGTDAVQGINSGKGGNSASALSRSSANMPGAEALASEVSYVPSGTEALASELSYVPSGTEALASELSYVPNNATSALVDASDMALVGDVKQAAAKEFNLFKAVGDFDYKSLGNKTLELGKKFGKAMFYDGDKLDRAAVMGAIAFAGSYAEALALADDAGVELTEEAYDEAKKEAKQEEYAGYLENFFAGKKDGGRIGFKDGANKTIEEKIAELESLTNKLMTEQGIQDRGYASQLASDIINMKNESIDPDRLKFLNNESALFALPRDMRPEDEYYDTLKALENRANGGRIGFESGANEMIKTQLLEEIMPETTTEDFIIIMTEDGPVRVKKSDYDSMPGMFRDTTTGEGSNMFRRIEEADGGRIGYARGSEPEEAEIGIMSIDVEAGDDEDMEDMDMAMAFPKTIFSGSEISRLFSDRSLTTNLDRKQLYKVLMNPGMFPDGEKMLIKMLRGKADGGRIGLKGGSGSSNRVAQLILERDYLLSKDEDVSYIDAELESLGYKMKAEGGIMEAKVPTGQMRENNAGVAERDYRQTGGFVPVGIKERADDVPAMLSKNEFVMTADAVRGIGNGSVEEGSKKLYNTMKQAEKVGKA